MKKIFLIVVIISLCLVVYGMTLERKVNDEALSIEIRNILELDLENEYPDNPYDVIQINSMITKVYYLFETKDEVLEEIIEKQRLLYSQELLDANPQKVQFERVKKEIEDYADRERVIISWEIVENIDEIEYYYEDNKQLCNINVVYYIMENEESSINVHHEYILIKEDDNWSVLGWEEKLQM